MPEYLAPGVFVEETSFRQKTIEGVSTSTTGFAGPTRFGPVDGEPPLLTSFTDFERIYGGLDALRFGADDRPNYTAHAVRAYFEEGGKRLHVARVFQAEAANDGIARWTNGGITVRARHPGGGGNARIALVFRLSENVLHSDASGAPVLRGATHRDTVFARIRPAAGATPDPSAIVGPTLVERVLDANGLDTFRLVHADGTTTTPLTDVDRVRVLTLSVIVRPPGRFAQEVVFDELAFDPAHRNSIHDAFGPEASRRATELFTPIAIEGADTPGAELAAAFGALTSVATGATTVRDHLVSAVAVDIVLEDDNAVTIRFELTGGNDGVLPLDAAYAGVTGTNGRRSGLAAFEDLEDISIVAAPGSTDTDTTGPAVIRHLITHCERMRYRIAVLDSVRGQIPEEIRNLRGEIDSTRAALYYPWVLVSDPMAVGEPRELALPPSGFVCGVYARTDAERGVHKAPANETVRLAMRLETLINHAQQEALNPRGINCLRFFPGRGFRVWGARTASSDPEWKYVNVRRYFAFVERSIEKGTQWAVFEPNGPRLWTNVQRTVEDFLYNEFVSNRLAGRKPAEAYFVRCDETTMTQNDRDNGRLICLVGVAPLYPAEFVIFRIGQKTADARG